jgi:hypothetical protein
LCLSREAAGALEYSDIGQHHSTDMVGFCLQRFREGVPSRLLVDGTFVLSGAQVGADQVVANVRFGDYMQPAAMPG